jgi:hypothetical protein
MRRLVELITAFAAATAIVGCMAPTPTKPAETAPGFGPGVSGPSLPVPGSPFKRSVPSPTIEIPPPVD